MAGGVPDAKSSHHREDHIFCYHHMAQHCTHPMKWSWLCICSFYLDYVYPCKENARNGKNYVVPTVDQNCARGSRFCPRARFLPNPHLLWMVCQAEGL